MKRIKIIVAIVLVVVVLVIVSVSIDTGGTSYYAEQEAYNFQKYKEAVEVADAIDFVKGWLSQ